MATQSRREVLASALGGGALLAGGAQLASASAAAPRSYRWSDEELKAKFKDPIWNRETSARIEADIAPGKFVNGYVTGTVMGVRDNEPVRPLMGFEVFSSLRVLKQPNGD